MKSLTQLKSLLEKRAAVGKQILAAEKKLVEEAEAIEKSAVKAPAAKKPAAKAKAVKPLLKK